MAHKIDPDACVACGSCIDECPLGAISAGDVFPPEMFTQLILTLALTAVHA